MNTPLWYTVSRRKFTFTEFDYRFSEPKFPEREVLPILILSALYHHDPYVDGIHVLQKRISNTIINDREFRALYLYWAFGKSFRSDTFFSGNALGGGFHGATIELPGDFSHLYLYQWINLILKFFFKVGSIQIPEVEYHSGNLEQLNQALKFTDELMKEGFTVKTRTIPKMYKLGVAHSHLKELKGFFLGVTYPRLLKRYRHHPEFFQSAVDLYWPNILHALHLDSPFTPEQLDYIKKSHQKLLQSGDLDFVISYIESLSRLFGADHEFVNEFKSYLEPSPENDSVRAFSYLSRLSPTQRSRYFLQKSMVSSDQLSTFIESIKKEGFEKAISPYLAANKERIDREIGLTGSLLINDSTLTGTNIYLHQLDDLIFYTDGQSMFVFLKKELPKFDNRRNPYNRQPLPDCLFEESEVEQADPIDESWSAVLRRPVRL